MHVAVGAYEKATPVSVLATGAEVVLAHQNDAVAVAVRAAHPYAEIILRPDPGVDDGTQVDTSKLPEAEADRWFGIIQRRLQGVPRHTYTAVTGINEAFPSKTDRKGLLWRAAFEAHLCKRVQIELLLWYAALSCPVANLEPEHLDLFDDVFSTAGMLNYHGYLQGGRTTLAQETDPWYLWRPLDMWLPRLKQLGLRLPPLLLGEVGPFTDWRGLRLSAQQAAQLCIDVGRAFEAKCRSLSVGFVGGCCFGLGTVGTMAAWDLTGTEAIFRGGNQSMALSDQFPKEYQAWVAAGGVENNLRAHLLGIKAIKATKDDVSMLVGQVRSSTEQLANVVASLPFA